MKTDLEKAKRENPRGRVVAEWAIFNKIVGIPLWPAKVFELDSL